MDQSTSILSSGITSAQSQAIDEMVRSGRFSSRAAALREIVGTFLDGGESEEIVRLREENESLKAELEMAGRTHMERVSVFLDVRNVLEEVRRRGFLIDYAELKNVAVSGRHLVEATAFDGRIYTAERDTTKPFHDVLMHSGWGLDLREIFDTEHQKEVDVALAARLMAGAVDDSYDTAVIISGDRDFIPAIEYVRALGKRIEIMSYERSLAVQMRRVADRVTILDDAFIVSITSEDAAEAAA